MQTFLGQDCVEFRGKIRLFSEKICCLFQTLETAVTDDQYVEPGFFRQGQVAHGRQNVGFFIYIAHRVAAAVEVRHNLQFYI
jgi:hypothetical protein